jgi:hypothetical protein
VITGQDGLDKISSFVVAPFTGVLCLFLLDMGLVAGRGLREARGVLNLGAVAFGVLMPVIGGLFGLGAGLVVGFLAMLELVKERLVVVTQMEPMAPIYVKLADAAEHA